MVREVTQPSARYTAPAPSAHSATSSRIPIASSSRIPYAKPTPGSTSNGSSKASATRRPVLGERNDLSNISLSSSTPSTIKKTIKPRTRLTPKKPITIITRISSSPASSLASPNTSMTFRAGATPHARHISPSMETRVFRFNGDDTMLLDMEPPSSIAGMSSPGTEYDEWEARPVMAVRGAGRMMTPANSQEVNSCKIVPAPVARSISRLPTPPSSQHAEEGDTTFRTSRIRPREAPTPPRRHTSKETLASPVQNPSPNPRRKKSPRVDMASPSRPTLAARSTLSGLSRLAGHAIPSTPTPAASSQPIPVRVIPSTAPPARRARASTAPKKAPVKATKARQSLPAPAKRRQSTPRARQSMTPDAIVALSGKPLGFLPRKIEAEPGDDPLILKGLEDDDEWLERRKLSRSQTVSQGKSRSSPNVHKAVALSSKKNVAGPSRLREVVNRPRSSDASSLGSPVRQARASNNTIFAESPSVTRSLQQYLAENGAIEEPQPDIEADTGMYDLQFDALPEWASDDDSDGTPGGIGNDTFADLADKEKPTATPRDVRQATPAEDIDPGSLPPSSPAWTGRNADVSTTPAGTPPPRMTLRQVAPPSPAPTSQAAETRQTLPSRDGAGAEKNKLELDEDEVVEAEADETLDAISDEWDNSTEEVQPAPHNRPGEAAVDLASPVREEADVTAEAIYDDWNDLSDGFAPSQPVEEDSEEAANVSLEAPAAEWHDSAAATDPCEPAEDEVEQVGDVTAEAVTPEWDISAEILPSPGISTESVLPLTEDNSNDGAAFTAEAANADSNGLEDDGPASISPDGDSNVLDRISTTPAGSPIARPIVPIYITPLKFATPALDRRQSRVSLRVPTPFQRAASEPVTPPSSSECGDEVDITQEALSPEWDISVEDGASEEKESSSPSRVKIFAAPRFSPLVVSPSSSISLDEQADLTHDAVEAEWEDEQPDEHTGNTSSPVDQGDAGEVVSPFSGGSPLVTESAEPLAPEQEIIHAMGVSQSPPRASASLSPETSFDADVTEEALDEDWVDEADEIAMEAESEQGTLQYDTDTHAPPSPSFVTRSAVAFLMASASTTTLIDDDDADFASARVQEIAVESHIAVSKLDSVVTPEVEPISLMAPSSPTRDAVSATPTSPATVPFVDATQPGSPSRWPGSPLARASVVYPSSPASSGSVAGDETQEAFPDAWDTSVDHSAMSFHEHVPNSEADSPESHSPAVEHFDFTRDDSPLSPARIAETLPEQAGHDSIVANREAAAVDAAVPERAEHFTLEGKADQPGTAVHSVLPLAEAGVTAKLRHVESTAPAKTAHEDRSITLEALSVRPLIIRATPADSQAVEVTGDLPTSSEQPASSDTGVTDVAVEGPAEAGITENQATRSQGLDNDLDDGASDESAEADQPEDDQPEEDEPEEDEPENGKIVLKVVNRGIIKVESLSEQAEAEQHVGDHVEDHIAVDAEPQLENISGDHDGLLIAVQQGDISRDDSSFGVSLTGFEPLPATLGTEDAATLPTRLASLSAIPASQVSQSVVHEQDAGNVPQRRQIQPPTQRPASVQSAGMSAVEAMLIRRQSASSSTTTRPSKLSLVAAAASQTESAAPRPLLSRSAHSRRSLGDEIAFATGTEVDEEVGSESFKSVVEVSSLDPRAAARAAAILKMASLNQDCNHAYIEHGILPSTSPTPSSSNIPLPKTPLVSSSALPRTPRSARSARRRAFESKHFDTVDSARKLNHEELLYEAELEIVASRRSRSRSRARSLGTTEGGYASDETESPVPGGWKVTSGKRKRSREIGTRLTAEKGEDSVTRVDKGKGKAHMHERQSEGRPWGVAEWKKLEKVYRAEKEEWVKEREVKPLPGLLSWAKKALGGEVEVKEWDNERVVMRFLDQEKAHGQGGEWAEKMIRLRVKALEKRVNAPRLERSSGDDRRESKKQRVEEKRRAQRTVVPATPARDDLGDSTVVSIVPPSTIRRMLGYVWRPAAEADTSLTSIASEDNDHADESQGVDDIAPGLAASSAAAGQPRVENKLLTRLKEVRDGGRAAGEAPSTPVREPASTPVDAQMAGSAATTTPMHQVGSGLFSPAHPASPAWSPAIPGKWVSGIASSRPAASAVGISGSPHRVGASTPASGTHNSSSLAHASTSTPKLYPSLNPPLTQRSTALQALFDTPRHSGSSALGGISGRKKESPSVREMVRSFEEEGVLGRGYSKEGLKRAESRGL